MKCARRHTEQAQLAFQIIAAELTGDADGAPVTLPAAPQAEGLHICSACGSPLVQPVDIEERDSDKWYLELRCPNCWWTEAAVFDRVSVLRLELELDRGAAELATDLGRLAHANLAQEIERFVQALNADAIQPMDF